MNYSNGNYKDTGLISMISPFKVTQ